MKKKLKRKEKVKFSGRNHSVKGLISLVMGLFIGLFLLAMIFYASISEGNSGVIIGFLGISLGLLSLVGFFVGATSLKEKEIHYGVPIGGTILNGVLVVVFLLLFLLGFIL